MTLIFQTLAVLLTGVLIAALLGTALPRGAGIGTAIGVIATFLFFSQTWPLQESLRAERTANAGLSKLRATHAGASIGPTNVAFLEWVRQQFEPGDTFALATGEVDEFAYQWSTYHLYPGILTSAERADWLVFYRSDPKQAGYDKQRFPRIETFEPNHALARAADAD